MSGQQMRYYSSISFEQADKSLSWALEIKDVLTLVWDAKDKKIIYIKGENYTPQRLRFWVYHTFFPLVLELQRIYRILHVGAVEINGKPVLFSAFSFGVMDFWSISSCCGASAVCLDLGSGNRC